MHKINHLNLNKGVFLLNFQGKDVFQNRDEGVLVTQTSLVLQSVDRRNSGSYSCRASNVEGDSTSKPKHLSIHCESLLINLLRHY